MKSVTIARNYAEALFAAPSAAYTKALLTASPTTWLDIYGQFLFSQPDSHVHYQQTDAGNLYLQSQVLFYSSEQQLIAASAATGRSRLSGAAELRVKESDRIALLARNLSALGIEVREQPDGLELEGGVPRQRTHARRGCRQRRARLEREPLVDHQFVVRPGCVEPRECGRALGSIEVDKHRQCRQHIGHVAAGVELRLGLSDH